MRAFASGQFLRTLCTVVKVLTRTLLRIAAALGFVFFIAFVVLMFAISSGDVDPAQAKLVYSAASQGKIAYGLTTPKELDELLGFCPFRTTVESYGERELYLDYQSGVHAVFLSGGGGSFTLVRLTLGGTNFQIGSRFHQTFGGKYVDIGYRRPTVLRNEGDLKKLDPFWGFCGVSLVGVDLRSHRKLVDKMPFDSRTEWPEPNKMPEGFDPRRLLEEGKNPGLGIPGLHKEGIDGRGVGIAILDQPLLKNHIEYANKIVHYETKGLMTRFLPPRMHGAPVASIAVGKTCGVAPGAQLSYYAMRMTAMPDNKIYCDIIDGIIESNRRSRVPERIRVVSISTGTFDGQANFDRWKETLAKADENGILVVTCDPMFLHYGTLERISSKDPDNPSSYRRGRYGTADDVLLAPAGNRTTASHKGQEIYTYWTGGGMSWAAPYLAGLAALAYQVNPRIEPKQIVELWLKTAVHTDAGPVVNPVGFIEAVQKLQ